MKPGTSTFAMAWGMALAPLFLFIPAIMLAGMGPCAFAHPMVIVVAILLFIFLEIAALPCFVKAARAAGKVMGAMIGMGLTAVLLVLCVAMEYYAVAEYWADAQFGV
jgi:hypothetical protein